MVEKVYFCMKCQWAPQNKDEQSAVCPKCGNECTQLDFIHKEDMQAWQNDIVNNSKYKLKGKS